MKKTILLLFLFPIFLFSTEITFQWLESKPKSHFRNFYIYQYLKQDITPEQAYEVLPLIKNMSTSMFYAFAQKSGNDETIAVAKCMKADIKKLINENPNCLAAGFSAYKITLLNNLEANKAKDILKDKYANLVDIIDVIKAPIPFSRLVSSDESLFFDIFNNVGSKYRQEFFNYSIPKNFLLDISKNKTFEQTIKLIVKDNNLDNLQKNLIDLNDSVTDTYSHQTNFFLALNAIKENNNTQALKYLEKALKKAYYKNDKDKVLFWKYLVNDDNSSLEEASNSWDNNLYSLYAKELTNKKPQNIIYDLNVSNLNNDYNISDPFTWLNTLEEIKKVTDDNIEILREKYAYKNTLAHYAFILERYNKFKNSYYITPYKQFLDDNNISVQRQTLLYALGKQESHFIPSTISSSYAMGVMQIMPFLSKDLAKQLNEEYNIYDQLNPEINLLYSNKYLDYLTSKLDHPLYIAYAYNGGIGNYLRNIKPYFNQTDNKYEPFMSMELVNLDETREYGKKVLSNYFIYKNYFEKEDTKLSSIFQMLK